MPAAKTKTDLIAIIETEWDKLDRALRDMPRSLAEIKDADATSIKDVLTHRAHWIGLFFQWLHEG